MKYRNIVVLRLKTIPYCFRYEESKKQNITTFAVGVGNYDVEELRTLANGNTSYKRVLTVTSYSSLPKEISELENKFCTGTNTMFTIIAFQIFSPVTARLFYWYIYIYLKISMNV